MTFCVNNSTLCILIYNSRYCTQPGFVCSKRRGEMIDAYVGTLKFPSGWEKLKNVIRNARGLHIGQALVLCGPFGAYLVGLTDIEVTYKNLWIPLLRDVAHGIIEKVPNSDDSPMELPQLQQQLVYVNSHTLIYYLHFVAIYIPTFRCHINTFCTYNVTFCTIMLQVDILSELELKLPLYWCTLTRHMLVCRLIRQLERHGAFWAQNALTFEREHVFVKSLLRSSKHLMSSIAANYGLNLASQLWRFDNPEKWVMPGKLSSLYNRTLSKDPALALEAKPLIGKKNYRPLRVLLTDDLFTQVQDLWAIHEPVFDRLRERWNRGT